MMTVPSDSLGHRDPREAIVTRDCSDSRERSKGRPRARQAFTRGTSMSLREAI